MREIPQTRLPEEQKKLTSQICEKAHPNQHQQAERQRADYT
jgi:hypothetical protein